MSVPTFTKTGNKASSEVSLDKAIFEVSTTSHQLMKQAYVAQQSNARSNNATTKLRGEVRGGGRKPHRQKGTGKARAGSIRSPLWRGGGITFGPTGEENYTKKINKQAKQAALKQALSVKHADSKVFVIDSLETDGKTKPVADLIKKLAPNSRRTLFVVEEFSDEINRSTRNLQGLKVTKATYLNIVDVLDADLIIVTKKSLDLISQWLGAKK